MAPEVDANGRNTTLIGAISEHAAITRLLSFGHKVAVPVVDDDGVDLIVNYRHTVNVKSARRPHRQSAGYSNTYVFNLTTWEYRREAIRNVEGRARQIKRRSFETVRFLICHGVADDAWWIVPVAQLPSSRLLSLSMAPVHAPKSGELSLKYRDAWHLFN